MVKDRNQERLALNYAASLQRIGVEARVRLVDEVQYQRRRQKFDFDMMLGQWIASASPGNEQRMRWGSASATQEGSFNLAARVGPAIDALIAALLAAQDARGFRHRRARLRPRAAVRLLHRAASFTPPNQWIAHASDIEASRAPAALRHADVRPDARKLVEGIAMTQDLARTNAAALDARRCRHARAHPLTMFGLDALIAGAARLRPERARSPIMAPRGPRERSLSRSSTAIGAFVAQLRQFDLEPGARILLCCPPRAQTLVAFTAIIAAGVEPVLGAAAAFRRAP